MLPVNSFSRSLLITLFLITSVAPALGRERVYELDDGHAIGFDVDSGYENLDGPERTDFGECLGCQPFKLPVAITAVRHLQGENWLHELEVKVKNISERPIYYVRFGIAMPGVIGPKYKTYGLFLRYGRPALISPTHLPGPQDTPIKPGGSYIFKVPDVSWKRFTDYMASIGQTEASVEKVVFRFDTIKFEDGSGYANGGLWELGKLRKDASDTH